MASLHIDKEYDDLLNQLKTRLGLDKKQIVEKAIHYIHKNKINPENLKEADLSGEIKLLRKDFVGFIKTMESTKLDPIINRLDLLVEGSKKSNSLVSEIKPPSDDFKKLVAAYNFLIENNKKLSEQIQKNDSILLNNIKMMTDQIQKMEQTVESKIRKNII
jgi:hypothetical protein